MSGSNLPPTSTEILAESSDLLKANGYRSVRKGFHDWDTTSTRLFEDDYNIVGVAVFGTVSELIDDWPTLQGSLVQVISQCVGREEQKAWDGYLVLLTTGIAPSEDAIVEAIRYETSHVRKLVATGDDLRAAADVKGVLRTLLPLRIDRPEADQTSVLVLLPSLLESEGVTAATTSLLIDSFTEQKSMMEALHRLRGEE